MQLRENIAPEYMSMDERGLATVNHQQLVEGREKIRFKRPTKQIPLQCSIIWSKYPVKSLEIYLSHKC